MQVKNIAVFLSGSGSNFQSIIDAVEQGKINGKIRLCLSSNADAYGLIRAKNHGIPSVVFNRNEFASLSVMYEKIIALLKDYSIDLIILAGYMTILTENIVGEYKNAIINVHPSLIPKFCGKGFYGMRVHRAVIESGEKESGATVHFVDEGTDTGAIILQKSVEVYQTDTPEILQKRVLEVEHTILPEAVKLFCEDKLSIPK